MRRLVSILSSAALFAAGPAYAAAPTAPVKKPAGDVPGSSEPAYAPRPTWVRPIAPIAPDPSQSTEPFQILLIDGQERLSRNRVENYVRTEFLVQNQVGAQALSTFAMPWHPDVSTLQINSLQIIRGEEVIDVLDPTLMRVIQNEDQLSKSTVTGLHMATMPVRALQVGDRLRMEVTYVSRLEDFGKTEDILNIRPGHKLGLASWSVQVEPALAVRWSVPDAPKGEAVSGPDGYTGQRFEVRNYSPPEDVKFAPERFTKSLVQVSAYKSWADVAEPMIPFYQEARKLGAASPVRKIAADIAAKHSDPQDRMVAALRAVQDQVRYVALLLREGRYRPPSADKVWEQRYGDCKGKSALLLALLDELGISAEPVLASVSFDGVIAERLPSLAILDHVFVRAKIGGQYYYLDGTNLGQRTLEELKFGPVQHAIPIASGGTLLALPDPVPSQPLTETNLTWDATQTLHTAVPFKARLILRGSTAAKYRIKAQAGSTDKDFLDGIKSLVAGVDNDDLELVASNPEEADGSYTFDFSGRADLDWRPVDGMKGNRFEFSNSTINWKIDFKRDEKSEKIPVNLESPYWDRSVETIILPDSGKDYFLDAKPIDRTVAGTMFHRSVTLESGRATSISDFKRIAKEIDGKDAIAAKPVLDELSDDIGYVVAKRKLKLPKAE